MAQAQRDLLPLTDDDRSDDSAERPVLTTKGACRLLMVSENHLYDLVNKRGLPGYHTGRAYRFHREALLEWLRTRGATEAAQRLDSLLTEEDERSAADGGAETDTES